MRPQVLGHPIQKGMGHLSIPHSFLANDPNNHTMGSEFTPYYLILMSQGVAFNLKNFYSMIDRHSFVIVSRKKQSHKIIIPGIRLKEGRKR